MEKQHRHKVVHVFKLCAHLNCKDFLLDYLSTEKINQFFHGGLISKVSFLTIKMCLQSLSFENVMCFFVKCNINISLGCTKHFKAFFTTVWCFTDETMNLLIWKMIGRLINHENNIYGSSCPPTVISFSWIISRDFMRQVIVVIGGVVASLSTRVCH